VRGTFYEGIQHLPLRRAISALRPGPTDLSIVFMYCPFMGELCSEAMARLFSSHDRNPRPLHILYAYPWEHNRLLATGRVEVVDVHPA